MKCGEPDAYIPVIFVKLIFSLHTLILVVDTLIRVMLNTCDEDTFGRLFFSMFSRLKNIVSCKLSCLSNRRQIE